MDVSIPKFPGFSTVSGKTVNVSEAALNKARRIFQDADDFDAGSSSTPKMACGFATASGKQTRVSREAVLRAQRLFAAEDLSNSDGDPIVTKSTPKPTGFSTASGNKTHVSASALEKAKSLFNEIQDDCKTEQACFSGFSTAAGTKTIVSEAALKKAKAIFAEDNEDAPAFIPPYLNKEVGHVASPLGSNRRSNNFSTPFRAPRKKLSNQVIYSRSFIVPKNKISVKQMFGY